jgi:hypothetical protein
MISGNGPLTNLDLEETNTPVLHVRWTGPNKAGMYRVEQGFTGLTFASLVLLGPQVSMVAMTETELLDLLAGLGDSILVKVEGGKSR